MLRRGPGGASRPGGLRGLTSIALRLSTRHLYSPCHHRPQLNGNCELPTPIVPCRHRTQRGFTLDRRAAASCERIQKGPQTESTLMREDSTGLGSIRKRTLHRSRAGITRFDSSEKQCDQSAQQSGATKRSRRRATLKMPSFDRVVEQLRRCFCRVAEWRRGGITAR